jgi:hypothetical protein
MNSHIIIEDKPHALRNALLSGILSCGIFFTLGFFGRDVWHYHFNPPQEVPTCKPGKPTLKWSVD